MSLSYGEIAEICKIIDASNLEEVVLELEGARLVVRRGADRAPGPAAATPAAAHGADEADKPAATKTDTGTAPETPARRRETPSDCTICSPMVGTFYRRPTPDQPPFVEVGSRVSAGDPLCLIEVMKLYTTIEATAAGSVAAVLAEDGDLVEFEQPLFIINS